MFMVYIINLVLFAVVWLGLPQFIGFMAEIVPGSKYTYIEAVTMAETTRSHPLVAMTPILFFAVTTIHLLWCSHESEKNMKRL